MALESESSMIAAAGATEVWLRSNPRPAIVVGGLFVLVAVAAVAAAAASGVGGWCVAAIAAAGLAGGGLVAAAVASASWPRLVRRGRFLRVRLSPIQAHDVPLEIVECVFPGSAPLAAAGGGPTPRRVSTVVLRLAERATAWRRRPTLAGWGSWDEGQIVIDGRWCEPLGREVTTRLGQRLQEAKRELAAMGHAVPGAGR